MRRVGTLSVAAVLATGLIAGCSSSSSEAPAPTATTSATASGESSDSSGVVTVTGLPHDHFQGVKLTYSRTPPLGGDHSPVPLNCAVYTAPVPTENAVHSLEHGAVWLTYADGVDPAPLGTLAELDTSYVLVSPYPGQPAKVIATAWGLQLKADSATDPRLKQFVQEYAGGGQGGEPGAPCAGATPQQAEQLLAKGPPPGQAQPPSPADQPGS